MRLEGPAECRRWASEWRYLLIAERWFKARIETALRGLDSPVTYDDKGLAVMRDACVKACRSLPWEILEPLPCYVDVTIDLSLGHMMIPVTLALVPDDDDTE